MFRVRRMGGIVTAGWAALVVLDILFNVVLIGQTSLGFTWRVIAGVVLSLVVISLPLLRFVRIRRTEYSRFRELFTLLSDGIIVMNPDRRITFMNPSAVGMTGFQLNDSVPYCLYCQQRTLPPGQERCLLAEERKRHYFESELPTNKGWVNVGMSRTFLSPRAASSERDMVITIRDVTAQKREEELRLSRSLTHHTYKIQEEERKRLSQDLHDGVSQTLYGISLGLEHLSRHMENPKQENEVQLLHKQVKSATEEVRSLSHSLYPATLDRIGLVATLRTMADNLTTLQRIVRFTTNFPNEPPLRPDTAVHLYRITQEAVHNAVMHGRASKIGIAFVRQHNQVQLRIQDNGSGFSEAHQVSGYGLHNMEERARAIGADLTVHSDINSGTTVELNAAANNLLLQTIERGEE